MSNLLFYGDNLSILRNEIKDESIDLIYLDPPFKSNATYNILFKGQSGKQSSSQIRVFEDTWRWGMEAENAFDEIMKSGENSNVSEMIRSMRIFLGQNDMMAYLVMMAVRLVELHRVLKPGGSIYLHCDDTASHYIKVLMDAVFGQENYVNNIVWRRATSHNDPKRFGRIADHILFYSKSGGKHFWNGYAAAMPKTEEEIKDAYPSEDERGHYRTADLTGSMHNAKKGSPSSLPWRGYDVHSMGRHWSPPKTGFYARYIEENLLPGYLAIKGVHERLDALDKAGLIHHPKKGKWPGLKRYAAADQGNPPQNIILKPTGFTNYTKGKEYLGYPTQKPLALLEKLIKVSSKKGDVVLDPFCGCGTAVHAAQKLGRKWIGIDVTHLAISLVERRLTDAFPKVKYEVHGTPKDLEGARELAKRDKYQFEWWALSLVKAIPYQGKKRGADSGIDGLVYFQENRDTNERVVIQVKGGASVGVSMIRDLKGTMEREKAPLGLLVTLAEPTAPMKKEAVAAGFHTIYGGEGRRYPKVQIITIEELLGGKTPEIPRIDELAFKKTPRELGEMKPEKLL
ncbi:MAG: DNA methyltransferase [Candidatus Dadabacteria bacterium]|nr:DNA methyltransferase [Candidatus Dadabacteria bacterium]